MRIARSMLALATVWMPQAASAEIEAEWPADVVR